MLSNSSRRPTWFAWAFLFCAILIALVRAPTNLPSSDPTPAPLGLASLPHALLYSWLRMLAAYFFSLGFAFIVGTLAATNTARERVLLPIIDILQSIPILGFFPSAIFWFVRLGGERTGVEAAVIFLIFTSQSWNLVFAVFDAIRAVPAEAREALRSLGIGPLGFIRRLYLPASFPRLVDNSILSWSNGWFFLMACEIIALGPASYRVPGLGSFLSDAIDHSQWSYVIAGIAALVLLIGAMDIFIWRPLGAATSLFKFEATKNESDTGSSIGDTIWKLYTNSPFFAPPRLVLASIHSLWVRIESLLEEPSQTGFRISKSWRLGSQAGRIGFWATIAGVAFGSGYYLVQAILQPWGISPLEILESVGISSLRILVAYIICLCWMIPLVYWIHRKPAGIRVLKSSAQILASVPATAFFPIISVFTLAWFKYEEVTVHLLLITGMVWYLLFNIIGGAIALPNDLREASDSLGIKGWLYVKKVFMPVILPSLITGSITAVGGGWNTLIIAEYFKVSGDTHSVMGIGSLIAKATYEQGNSQLLALCLLFMVSFIILVNRLLWQPLYKWAEQKYRLEG